MRGAIDEVIAVAAREGIDADIVKHGELKVARSAAQVARLEAELAADAAWGSEPGRPRPRRAGGARARRGRRGRGAFNPDCARVQPAKLVRGPGRRRRATGRDDPRVDRGRRGGPRRRDRAAGPRARADRPDLPGGVHRRRWPTTVATGCRSTRRWSSPQPLAATRRGSASAGSAPSCWATRPTPTSTRSARPTGASRWAAAACPTASARAPTSAAAPSTGRCAS